MTEISSKFENGVWSYTQKLEFYYENGQVIRADTYTYQDGDWVKVS